MKKKVELLEKNKAFWNFVHVCLWHRQGKIFVNNEKNKIKHRIDCNGFYRRNSDLISSSKSSKPEPIYAMLLCTIANPIAIAHMHRFWSELSLIIHKQNPEHIIIDAVCRQQQKPQRQYSTQSHERGRKIETKEEEAMKKKYTQYREKH